MNRAQDCFHGDFQMNSLCLPVHFCAALPFREMRQRFVRMTEVINRMVLPISLWNLPLQFPGQQAIPRFGTKGSHILNYEENPSLPRSW